jgi:hypothetical protein
MEEFRKWMDNLPLFVKIIFALPVLDGIIYGIYRICSDDAPNMILGVIWLVAGATICWVLDIVFLLWKGKVFELKATGK